MPKTIGEAINEGLQEIPLRNVFKSILEKVINFCEFNALEGKKDDENNEFNAEFVQVDQQTLYELILAANYLNIKALLDLCYQTDANMIKGKTTHQIRTTFNVKNDFTEKEEEDVRKENQWAFEQKF